MSIEYQNKIDFLQYKLLNKAEDEGHSHKSADDKSGSFKELLGLCRSDLDEIVNRLKSQVKLESNAELLRK